MDDSRVPARMLIVSDDSCLRDQATTSFRSRFQVFTAEARPDALRQAEHQGPFALVLADLPPDGPNREGIIDHVNAYHSKAAVMVMDLARTGAPRGVVLH